MIKDGKIKKGVTLEAYLNSLKTLGEYDHKMDKPFLTFVSNILDITVVKPLIESYTGYDMITKEDLSDTERDRKALFAVIDLIPIAKGIRLIGQQGVK